MLSALADVALDLTTSLDSSARYERLVAAVHRVVPCDAAALLRNEDGALVAIATEGLSPEALGRRFALADHPRLAAIVASRAPVRFAADDPRPDPYDGLVAGAPDLHPHVHACMGSSLYVGDELVGVLTVDALRPDAFGVVDDATFATFAALAAAAMRTAGLIDALERAVERRGRVAEHLVAAALQRHGGELVGPSEAMQALRRDVGLIARSGLTALVTGETGVGKELVARTLHRGSDRKDEPLVYVNCAALPESVAESELFGHVRGAFT
ncbi:MAG: sigma 54-interacting transcriptional regulator, partial [Myxococcales bacterium]|nr:sigma 54-interacting transcriptional regulator [Myxococcales bacterium]